MNCPACGAENREGARFCGECAAPLVATTACSACGAANPVARKFCDACAAPLPSRPAAAMARPAAARAAEGGARKVVTIVFADLVGSTALHERLDAESVRILMNRYYERLHGVVATHDGAVVKLLGDGVMAAFGVPLVREDDAIRAVRAGVAMQRACSDLAHEQPGAAGAIALRVGVNTGEVVVSADDADVFGDPVNVAARLQQEARAGDVLIGESTRRLVADLVTLAPFGSLALKGRAERVPAYRVVSLARPAGTAATEFIGRDDELRRLNAVYDEAVATPAARLAIILGSPGLGKSRLLAELARRLGAGATVVSAHCDAAAVATFAPLADALRTLLALDAGAGTDAVHAAVAGVVSDREPERERIAGGITALLAGTPAPPEETFFVLRRLLVAIAGAKPAVLAIDDLQWAEPLLLDFIEHLIQWGVGVPLLVLGAARPELRDTRSAFATVNGLVTDVVTLGGLDAGAATRLAASVIGASELPAALVGRVLATSEGNPLFVGELVRMLVHDGALKREGNRWTTNVELARLEMPPTIHALLAARIERLRSEERIVLERAAVIGRQFSRAAVADLVPPDVRAELDARLESLRRSELIEPDVGWLLGEPVLRFHHVLIRDAAYRRVLKGTRAELHGRFAAWLESRARDSVEHDETIGWHLEQAHQHLCELGPIDAHGRELGDRAARYLGAAGRRALARDDMALAASLIGRAVERLDAADPARADLALDWCEALLSEGDVATGTRAVAELRRFIESSDRLRAWHTCFVGQLAALTDPQALRATVAAVAAAAETLTGAGDAAGEAKAHSVHAIALARLGEVGACEAALDRALAAARRARDRRRANGVLAGAPLAALWGPSPVTRASGRCLDVVRVLRITQGSPAVEAVALRCQAVLEALRGRGDAARRMLASSRRMVEELGITQRLVEADMAAGLIDLLEGKVAAAEPSLRAAYDGFRAHGLGSDAAQAAALLGRALLALGRDADAEALSRESEALAGDDLRAAVAWRGVRAEALARRGDHAAAIELAHAAVAIAAATDALLDHADARRALSVALDAAGRASEADLEEARARELWETKGATLLVERAARERPSIEHTERSQTDGAPAARTQRVAEKRAGASHRSDDRAAPAGDVRRRVRRSVQPNAATANLAGLDAAIVARDLDAIAALVREDAQFTHHPTETVYGREGALETFRAAFTAKALRSTREPLATLGDALALCRSTMEVEELDDADRPFGASQREQLMLLEVDQHGRQRGAEIFADDHVRDAVVRLYERYADISPDVGERRRAAAVARSVAKLPPGVFSNDEPSLAPDVEFVDHRALGFGRVHGIEKVRRGAGTLSQVADDLTVRDFEVLSLRPWSHLLRWTIVGIDRSSSGTFAIPAIQLLVWNSDGLISRWELFDPDHDAEALARFDELVPEERPPQATAVDTSRRRVRPNAATALVARFDAALAAHDTDAVARLVADLFEVDHRTGADFTANQAITRFRATLESAEDLTYAHEPLATLGDRLVLTRARISFAGLTDADLPFGAVISEPLVIQECDRGEHPRVEIFADDRLEDAIVRLYERYAELLPPGPARTRAAATARSVAAQFVTGSPFSRFAPDCEGVDRRTVGFGSGRGTAAFSLVARTMSEFADDVGWRTDDVLALEPDGLLLRRARTGTVRASGGTFERPMLQLFVFGADGLVTSLEQFDVDGEVEALARFDALVLGIGEPTSAASRIESTAALRAAAFFTKHAQAAVDELQRAWEGSDWDRFAALHAPAFRASDRRKFARLELDRDQFLASYREAFAFNSTLRMDVLATRGDRFMLTRHTWHFTHGDIGPSESGLLSVSELDGSGRVVALVAFDVDDLDAAYAELDDRYAAGEGVPHAALLAHQRAYGEIFDAETAARLLPDDFTMMVHRRFAGTGMPMNRAEFLEWLRVSSNELGADAHFRTDHLRVSATTAIRLGAMVGSADGGAFETPMLHVLAHDGMRTHAIEAFDLDQLDAALARYEELTAGAKRPRRIENAATRAGDRLRDAWNAHDWERFAALFPKAFRALDRPRTVALELDRERLLEGYRSVFTMPASRQTHESFATRGGRLGLSRVHWEGTSDSIGPSEVDFAVVVEVDERGDLVAIVSFDLDDLDAAYAELDRRYAAGEAHAHRRIAATADVFLRGFAARNWDEVTACLASDLVVYDHRLLGWETLHGPAAYVQALESLVGLAPDVRLRLDHVAMSEHGLLWIAAWQGTQGGGAFETPWVVVSEHEASGTVHRIDQWDLDQLDDARGRFEQLRA